jgi:hypothetical protein
MHFYPYSLSPTFEISLSKITPYQKIFREPNSHISRAVVHMMINRPNVVCGGATQFNYFRLWDAGMNIQQGTVH